MTTWRCPVCSGDLHPTVDRRAWRCASGHDFDVAKEGYVNLLITHQRRKREPGDSAEMMRDRRTFLDGGWYTPLRDALQAFKGRGHTLDAGCGEGYYTRGWPDLWAIDISKPAVRLAAKRSTTDDAHYAVASVYDTPLADASIDTVLSVFSPLPSAEFERVLTADGRGRVVTVTPGPRHLEGLAAHLFESVEAHPDAGPFERDGATTQLRLLDQQRISFELRLDDTTAIAALLGMTPYAWYVDEPTRERIRSLPFLSTPIEFLLSVYGR